jgi:hypothetical protein
MIDRYSPPTRLTKLPYKTIVRFHGSSNITYWVQTSKDSNSPEWKSPDNILGSIFKNLLYEEDFIHLCLDIIDNKTDYTISNIKDKI